MRLIALAMLLMCAPAFAQLWIPVSQAQAPTPTTVRVEHLSDDEYKTLAKLDKDRESTMDAYIKARDAYQDKRKNIESSHNAIAIDKCPFVRDVEWKGQYLIVDEYDHPYNCNSNFILTGTGGSITLSDGSTSMLHPQ